MTQMRIDPPGRILQACHIEQHASTGNNSVNNGIVLSANMHTAFDQGYVGIDRDYSIMVNDTLFEESNRGLQLDEVKRESKFFARQPTVLAHSGAPGEAQATIF